MSLHLRLTMVDSSVWVDFFHGRLTPDVNELKRLAKLGEVMTGDLILHEVLRGFDDDNLSAKVLRVLRRRGVAIRKPNDAIIASYCIDAQVPLLSSDRDFVGYEPLGLDLVRG